MLINDHTPWRQIYDRGGYKETWDNAASHLHCHINGSGHVDFSFVCGHGDGDDDDEDE